MLQLRQRCLCLRREGRGEINVRDFAAKTLVVKIMEV